jgi:hypothetical protein
MASLRRPLRGSDAANWTEGLKLVAVVAEAKLCLADRLVDGLDSGNAMPAEVVRAVIQVLAGLAKIGQRSANFGMRFTVAVLRRNRRFRLRRARLRRHGRGISKRDN